MLSPNASGFSALISMFDCSPCVMYTFCPRFSLFLSLIAFLKTLNTNTWEEGRAAVSLNQNQGYLYTYFIVFFLVGGEVRR